MLNTGKLAGKTLYITGASRGIGKSIALKAAQDGAKVVVAAKTADPHPKLPGTIFTAAKEIEAAGGAALPCVVDVRSEESVQASIEAAVREFGGIDIVINNASAINLTGTDGTSMKKFDLMHQINTRGTYMVSKLALPYLRASKQNPHILNISPPLNMRPRWFRDHAAYTMAKYGMSMCVLGMAEEFRKEGIAVNALWPKTAIITAAMEMLGGEEVANDCRTPDIMSDAAYVMLTRDSRNFTGNFSIDEEILREEGMKDMDRYAAVPGTKDFLPDFFLDEFDDYILKQKSARFVGGKDTKKAAPSSSGSAGSVQSVFDKMTGLMNEELVNKTKAVYVFDVTGKDAGSWYVDLKNGSGAVGSGKGDAPADVTFTLTDDNFHKMFKGELKPTVAFMSGKLKIAGDTGKALKLDKLMGKMPRGYHTSAAMFSSDSDSTPSVQSVFDKLSGLVNEELVDKTKAVYVFDVTGNDAGSWYVDLKNGSGAVGSGKGEAPADVTFTLNEENLHKMFAGDLKPTVAFMSGKLKIAGDTGKALKLEKLMGKMQSRGIHTSARRFAEEEIPLYTSVPQAFDRIGEVIGDPAVREKVNASYLFDIEGEGKYFVDVKTEGKVVKGGPEEGVKADVTINMNSENLVKLFNRELKPATAFMTGQLKLSGDLAKAMALEGVMKAARGIKDFSTWSRR